MEVIGIISTRVEQVNIPHSHPLWKVIDQNCFYSKNMYNYANYVVRQEFINNGRWMRYRELAKTLKTSDPYKELMSQPAQQTLALLDQNWKVFFKTIKDWKKNPQKYLGRPKLPGYKPKDGRYPWCIKNNGCRIRDGELQFIIKRLSGVKFPVRTDGRLLGVRFIPKGSCYVMEVIFEVEVPDIPDSEPRRIAGIDLGVSNLITMSNNIGEQPIIVNGKGIKAINQFYNKQKAAMQSDLKKRNDKHWSRRLEDLSFKRYSRIKTMMHIASRRAVNWCIENNIDTLICGLNKEWKQETNLGKTGNQRFISIPFDMLIGQMRYKCQSYGIRFITTEENYTSGTSFLDCEMPIKENYDKSRRKKRGLFQSATTLINADVNGACQIIKKVSPNAFSYGVEAESLQPIVINIA